MDKEARRRQQAANSERSRRTAEADELRRKELEVLYFELEMKQREIAALWGVKQTTVSRVMRRLGMTPSRRGKRNPRYLHGKAARPYRELVSKERCRACGSKHRLGIHHKNFDHFDNGLSNLEVLCLGCHMALHMKARHAARRSGEPEPVSNGPIGWER